MPSVTRLYIHRTLITGLPLVPSSLATALCGPACRGVGGQLEGLRPSLRADGEAAEAGHVRRPTAPGLRSEPSIIRAALGVRPDPCRVSDTRRAPHPAAATGTIM